MELLQVFFLALVQGAAELLPVSSSAHVIVAEKLLGLDPTAPRMTLLLVMLHTGTMFAVIVYFRRAWTEAYFRSAAAFRDNAIRIVGATLVTGLVGLGLMHLLKHLVAADPARFEIEQLFGNARLMAGALAAAGLLILASSRIPDRGTQVLTLTQALVVGAVQGLCLPFRGFSRSGATISTGMVLGVARRRAEEFSFALAVVLTPAVIAKEAWRLARSPEAHALGADGWGAVLLPDLLGMALAFLAGLGALRWLSSWLEHGRWHWFGVYCLVAAASVLLVG